jgi:sarcosine oxidase subunit beta
MPHTCDVLVVGGGVIGISTALHLARRGAGRVTLLERSFLGAGASGKSAALVHQNHACPLTAALAREALDTYERFGDFAGGPPVFWRTGVVWLTSAASPAPHSEAVVPIGGLELMEIDANARLADDEKAGFERQAGHVEAVQVLASLADAARRAGAELLQRVEVHALRADKGRLAGVETNEGVYECGRLVLATGAWADRLPGTLKLTLPVRPARTQMALFRRPVDSGRRGAVFIDSVQNLYLRPAQGDLIHAGNLAPAAPDESIDPDQINEAADSDWLRDIRQRLIRRYPPMHSGFGRGGYGALSDPTPDGRPIVDQLPGVEGVFCATGFRGDAFLLALPVGRLLADWVLAGQPAGPPVAPDLAPFRLARFEEAPATPAAESA